MRESVAGGRVSWSRPHDCELKAPPLGLSSVRGVRAVARQPVVGVGEVDSCRGHLVELLAVPRDGVGQVDDVEDLGAAEAGDLHSAHAGEATGGR